MTIKTHDTLMRFLFDNQAVRGARVQLHNSYQTIHAQHTCQANAARLLGESTAAAALLASTIKLEGRVSLQARGEGSLKLLVAECTHTGGLRGVIELDETNSHDECRLSALLENGYLAVSLLPDEGQSYQGLVPLAGDKLQDCIAAYFMQSEQLPTALWLACDGENAAGLLLQALPDNNEQSDDWQRLCLLANTLTESELLHLSHEELLHRLFHEDAVRIFEPTPMTFACTCSDERSRNALAVLGRDDLHKLFSERETIEVDCQFCRQQYRYTQQDFADFLAAPSHSIH